MATTATAVLGYGSSGNVRGWDVKASADADTTIAITHGITFADTVNDPDQRCRVTFERRGAKYQDQNWSVASLTATTLTLTKNGVAAGSGDAAAQVRVWLEYLAGPYA